MVSSGEGFTAVDARNEGVGNGKGEAGRRYVGKVEKENKKEDNGSGL